MSKFWTFLKANVIWCLIGTLIYWAIPYIIVTLLGLISPWFFTIYAAVFGIQVMLPAIPIIIGISLGVKALFKIFKKNNKKIVKNS